MDFKEVCCNIRSCLNSSKSQLSLTQLIRDYREVLGDQIPYRSLGFNSLEALIRAVPNLRITMIRGELFIDVKPDEKTAHIADLVREQRCSKKKKRKPASRGFYRGNAPPPRRPATMPPPKRSAPQPRSSEYYPSRRRDSPPRQQSYSNQRRPSPPRRTENTHYSNRKDTPSYQDYRNAAPIEISSDEDDRRPNIDGVCRKYRSYPSQYDFSDPNDDLNDGGASDLEDCDEINTKIEQLKVTLGKERQVSINKPKLRSYSSNTSNEDDFGYSSMRASKMNVAPGHSKRYYRTPSSDSYDDDYTTSSTATTEQPGSGEWSSSASQTNPVRQPFGRNSTQTYIRVGSRGRGYLLEKAKQNLLASGRGRPVKSAETEPQGNIKNEITAMTNESPPGEVSTKGKGDMANKSKMNVARTPAALLAAGRAMQEPNLKSTKAQPVRSQEPKLSQFPCHNFLKGYLSKNSTTHGDTIRPAAPSPSSNSTREPFRTMNKPPVISNERPSPTNSPVEKTKPNASPARSKMSDSNMFKPGPHVQPDLNKQKLCAKLQDFAIRHSLQIPQYKTFVKFCPKTKAASYMCKVKIGSSLSFTSCPYESNLIQDVQEYTAKIAYEELQKRHSSLDSDSLTVTTDENVIIKRIAEIVNPHSNGLKSQTIESKYETLHKEILPLDWLDIVKNRSLLSVEELMGGIMAVYPIEEGLNAVLDVSKLPPLVLPENEVWNVFVTCCTSTSCVYFRIIHDDYNGLYAAMDEKMFEVYEAKRETDELRHVEMVKEGSYYAANLEGGWFRVKALGTMIDDLARVCLIDHGDIDEVLKDELFPLDERFTALPAQKVSCGLTGLEQHSKEPYVTRIVSELTCGKAFVAKVDTRNPVLQLTLLDTSTEVDVNVNELIDERIRKELEPPKVPSLSNVTDAYLVSVKEDGLAYVQILSDSFKLLKSFLDEASEELAANYDKYRVKSTTELLGSKIFLARYTLDGLWYRVVIDRVVSENHIEVLFVDYGNLDVVLLKDIADVDHFTEALSIMPNQAVQVRLVRPNDELFTDNVLQYLMDLSTSKESTKPARFLLKTAKEGAIPDVYLYYRTPETNQLDNVNDLIAHYFSEFRGPNYVGVPLSNETLERLFPVPTYNVPCNEQITVHVTMISTPFNFIVQPHDDAAELIKLDSLMNEFYDRENPVVDVSVIKVNEIYAVKDENVGKWYRGQIVMLMHAQYKISAKLVDYGKIIEIKHSDIAHLLPCFRTLPMQAIRAELAGIIPSHSIWSVDDSLRFRNLAADKLLISVTVDVLEDGKISIILYDTSTDPVTDLGSVLVQEGRAKDITSH